jgi:hypothetical protein
MITIDDITLPGIASTICKNASTLRMQKLNNSSAKEPINTQYANKCATWMLGTIQSRSPVNGKKQMQASQCRLSKKLLQQFINESSFDGTLDDWKTKPVSFQQRKRIPHHNQAFPVLKIHKIPSSS